MDKYLIQLLNSCSKQDRKSQRILYQQYYGFALSVCLRYASNRCEAVEIMNRGYCKLFSFKLKYDYQKPFKDWLTHLMIETAIEQHLIDVDKFVVEHNHAFEIDCDVEVQGANLGYNELIALLQQLPDSLRVVYNLYVIDNYSVQDICKTLKRSEVVCDLQLSRARQFLRKMMINIE